MNMKKMIGAAVAAVACCASALDLNGTWEFRFDEGRPITAVAGSAFESTGRMVVPGCFDAMPDTFMKRGTAMYRRTFTLEKGVDRAWLVIDGMGLYGKFWVDGREIGVDDLPYSRVELATGPLKPGWHVIEAAVDNRIDIRTNRLFFPRYDFYSFEQNPEDGKEWIRENDVAWNYVTVEFEEYELDIDDESVFKDHFPRMSPEAYGRLFSEELFLNKITEFESMAECEQHILSSLAEDKENNK